MVFVRTNGVCKYVLIYYVFYLFRKTSNRHGTQFDFRPERASGPDGDQNDVQYLAIYGTYAVPYIDA